MNLATRNPPAPAAGGSTVNRMKGLFAIKIAVPAVLLCLCVLSPAESGQGPDKYKLKEGAKGKICLTCHVSFQDKMKEPFVHTPLRRGECSGCHNPHTSARKKLLGDTVERMCLRCHPAIPGREAASVHAAVSQGKCVQCHDPHAAQNKNNLLAAGNALCFGCHKNMAGAASAVKYQHLPAAKDCLTCHSPHASAEAGYLLKAPVPQLCIQCHKTDRPVFAKQHMNYPVGKSLCTNCHNAHGSNQKGILYDTVHKPVASRMCSQCHEDPGSATPLKTRKPSPELCKGCHALFVKEAFDKKRIHWPLADRKSCQNCHNPHASREKGLLLASQTRLCGSCHGDSLDQMAKVKSQHNPVKEGSCTACHMPHSSDNPQLLAKPGLMDLCGTCHDWGKHSNHPMGGKYRDLRNKNLAVDCSSCHRGHGTDHKRMLLQATVTEVCVQCHEKLRR